MPLERTERPEQPITITGHFFGIYDERADEKGVFQANPVKYRIGGEEVLPVFSTMEKMLASFSEMGVPARIWRTKQILEGKEFLASIEGQGVRVMVDPVKTPEGKIRGLVILGRVE